MCTNDIQMFNKLSIKKLHNTLLVFLFLIAIKLLNKSFDESSIIPL